MKPKHSHPSAAAAAAAAAGWHGPPPRGRGRWRAARVGTCSCRWGESASWTRTSFWARAGPGLSTAPRRPAGGDRDRVSALSYRGSERKRRSGGSQLVRFMDSQPQLPGQLRPETGIKKKKKLFRMYSIKTSSSLNVKCCRLSQNKNKFDNEPKQPAGGDATQRNTASYTQSAAF